ncbi:hypothetical protein ATANTOWER_016155 [Ataeniobius toweri]|uniref:Uncharacterized protein n=1 Tax=Ataeniobius toweri TaxID=208326 RepID=A0ABU7C1Y7_9TELE|nr:hypothetical protein [Ataeniobius toweri]
MVHPPVCAPEEAKDFNPSFSGIQSGRLRNPHTLSEGVPLSRPVSHIHSVRRQVNVRVMRDVFVPRKGMKVARSHFSLHKSAGAHYCVKSVTACCSSAAGSAFSDSHKQQSYSTLQKQLSC